MLTPLLTVNPASPEPDAIARAADCLRSGGLVAFPTETVYGLGVHALDAAAVRKLFAAKQRPADDPLIVHIADAAQLADVAIDIPDVARTLAERFWPGPLTLVLRRKPQVPQEVTAGGDTVAVRVPSHPVAQALLRAAGIPVAAPSANLFSRPSPTRAAHVQQDLDGRIDLILDGGPTSVGVESTVVDLTISPPVVWRPGAVTIEMLRQTLPDVIAGDEHRARSASETAHSPGLLTKHYAPRAPLTLYEGEPAALRARMLKDARELAASGTRVGVLVSDEDADLFRPAAVVVTRGRAGDPSSMARALYAALRGLDEAAVDVILASGIENADGLGAALQDRLRRAAAGRIINA